MSLIPFILDLADELHEFSRCLANGIDINDFGFGLYTGSEQQQQQPQQSSQQQQQQQQQSPRRSRTSSFSSFWLPSKRHHPYNRIKSACCGKSGGDEGGVTIATSPEKEAPASGTPGKTTSYSVVNKNGFQVSMNVKQFAPNELSVKTIDNCIVVEGRHDYKEDGHGVISRHFVRKYMLPKGYDPKDVLSTLSSDGILTVKAPPPPPPSAKTDEPNERIVEIQPTPGPTQVLPVVSAKEATQPKEQAKKLSSPATRDECQLPEKRQKLDLPQEEQESETAAPQTIPTTAIPAPTPSTKEAVVVPTANENEKAEEQSAETDKPQEQKKQKGEEENITDVETNSAAPAAEDSDEKQLEEKEAMEIDETEKVEEEKEKLPETNGDGDTEMNTSCENAEPSGPAEESCTTSAPDNDVPANENVSETDAKTSKSDASDKMEVDDVAESSAANNVDAAATEAVTADDKGKEEAKSETVVDGKASATETNNTTNSTPAKNPKKSDKDNTAANSTGEVPADDDATSEKADTTSPTTANAESANNDKVTDTETAVLATETTTTTTTNNTTTATTDIDDVALLKAAVTADAAEITAAEENALLSEPMDGIKTTDSSKAAVDSVECSLLAKTHLGNGNSNSAAALLAKEEVAN